MKSVKVHYFALLQDLSHKKSESIETELKTYYDLYLFLDSKYSFQLPAEMIQLAVNDEFANLNSDIKENSKIVFIPPVAGG
jgi:molybdopterin synthase sulfur carrier subunit